MAGRKLFGVLLLLFFCWFSLSHCLAAEMSHMDRYSLLLNYSTQAELLADKLQIKLAKSEAKSEALEQTVLSLEDYVAKSADSHKKELNRAAKINRRHWRQRIIWQTVAAVLATKIAQDNI